MGGADPPRRLQGRGRRLTRVATVTPDVTGLDKHFDYLVPDDLRERALLGALVRVELHHRRIGGWITALHDVDDAPAGLKPLAKVSSIGPSGEIIALAEWAAIRWAARRIRPFLVAASPERNVIDLPPTRRSGVAPEPLSPATTSLLADGGGVLRLPPRADVVPAVMSAAALGPTLVVVPTHPQMATLAARLLRAGLRVAVVAGDWAAAAGGVDVVIGTRTAAWAPCAGLAAAVVIDEHDPAHQDERSPTWHARDVVAERCRRAGVPYVMLSPIPTLVAVEEYAGGITSSVWGQTPNGASPSVGAVVHPPAARERAGWPTITVVDRTDEDPWKRSLVTSPLIERLRDPRLRVVCVSNTTGRARVLACRSCRALVRCERCEAAVGLIDDGDLSCRRCGAERPPVCLECSGSRFANLRPGVTRLREELEGAANRPVVAVTGSDRTSPQAAGVYVGTEAVLHRVRDADVVAFLEFDAELLAPRFRASEQAMALLVRAGRLASEVLVQTFVPDHEVIRAARAGDPDLALEPERARRRLLGLPPYGALAAVSGKGADELVAGLAPPLEVGALGDDRFLVRAPDWTTLGTALNVAERPPASRLRIAVDPPRE